MVLAFRTSNRSHDLDVRRLPCKPELAPRLEHGGRKTDLVLKFCTNGYRNDAGGRLSAPCVSAFTERVLGMFRLQIDTTSQRCDLHRSNIDDGYDDRFEKVVNGSRRSCVELREMADARLT